MTDWTRNPWKVLALGVVASVIATYVVRVLDWFGPVAWASGLAYATVAMSIAFGSLYFLYTVWCFRWARWQLSRATRARDRARLALEHALLSASARSPQG